VLFVVWLTLFCGVSSGNWDPKMYFAVPDPKTFAVNILDAESFELVGSLWGHRSQVSSLALADGAPKLASSELLKVIKVWDTVSMVELASLMSPIRETSLSLNNDGDQLLGMGMDALHLLITKWDLNSGAVQLTLEVPSKMGGIEAHFMDADNTILCSLPTKLVLFDATTGAQTRIFDSLGSHIEAIAVYSAEDVIAMGMSNKTIALTDISSGQPNQTLRGHRNAVHCVCFSGDGSRLASGSEDCTVMIWDRLTGSVVREIRCSRPAYFVSLNHTGTRVAFSPVSCYLDVVVYDVPAGKAVLDLPQAYVGKFSKQAVVLL
jgi:WD40 repeat protein